MIEIEKTDIYQKWLENLRDRKAKIIRAEGLIPRRYAS